MDTNQVLHPSLNDCLAEIKEMEDLMSRKHLEYSVKSLDGKGEMPLHKRYCHFYTILREKYGINSEEQLNDLIAELD